MAWPGYRPHQIQARARPEPARAIPGLQPGLLVHVGFDQYISGAVPCERAVAFASQRGLFTEPAGDSPLATEHADDTAGQRRPGRCRAST